MNIVIKKVWECSETVALLLQNGAEIDMQENNSWSSLMIASQNGHTETVALLLKNGAEIDMQENKGWSSLMIASENGHTETVAVLLQNGAEIDMQENTKTVHKLTCNRTMASLL